MLNPADEIDEPTEAIYLNKSQLEALIIGIPEMIEGNKFRIESFKSKEALPNIMEKYNLDEETAKNHISENIALAESLLSEIPEILQEIREAYMMISEKEEKKSSIITETPTWPPKNLSL